MKLSRITQIQGKEDGPISVILAGIHGNEPCGVKAFEQLLPELSIEFGEVFFIVGNPDALQGNKRFVDMNLNRAFSSSDKYSEKDKETLEYKHAIFIKEYLDKADALLDIHSALKKTQPFMFTEGLGIEVGKQLPKDFTKIVTSATKIEPGATDGYMSEKNKIGICVECGQHDDPNAVNLAKDAILHFLSAVGHKISPTTKSHKEIITLSFAYLTKTNSFKLAKKFLDFSFVTKGEIIGVDGVKDITAPENGIILFARDQKQKGTEGFLFAKK